MPAMVLFSCYIETVVIVCNTSACHYFGKKKNNSIYYSKSWFLYIITTCLWHTYDLDLYSDICKSMTVECLILVILLLLLQPATKYKLTNTFNKNLIIQICLQACQKYIMARIVQYSLGVGVSCYHIQTHPVVNQCRLTFLIQLIVAYSHSNVVSYLEHWAFSQRCFISWSKETKHDLEKHILPIYSAN